MVKQIIIGHILMIICCIFYIIWWYRCYRPNTHVNKASGINGILLLITALSGITGIFLSIQAVSGKQPYLLTTPMIIITGIIAYILLLLITRFLFHRIVTTELVLITVWTVLEVMFTDRLYAVSALSHTAYMTMNIVIFIAFAISMILYVAYYRMEENKAFYAAMIPLITEALAMTVLICLL